MWIRRYVMFLGELSKKIILPETFIRSDGYEKKQSPGRLRLRNKWLLGSC